MTRPWLGRGRLGAAVAATVVASFAVHAADGRALTVATVPSPTRPALAFQEPAPAPPGLRHPTLSADGRLVFEIAGDLWMAPAGDDGRPILDSAALVRLTSGPVWDRQPAWGPDGATVVFVSDRAGTTDLWRIGVDADGAPGEPERLTENTAPDTEPAVAADGTVVFVRGRPPTADLWTLATDGTETRLTEREGAEVSPTISPDATEVAYVSILRGRRELRRRPVTPDPDPDAAAHPDDDATDDTLASGARAGAAVADETVADEALPDDDRSAPTDDVEGDRSIVTGVAVEWPRWSPAGDRIVFSTRGGDAGVWIIPTDGRYRNLVSELRAAAAWSGDASWLLLAAAERGGPGYNGDPDRLEDREIGDALPAPGRIWLVEAPAPPAGAGSGAVTVEPGVVDAGEAFDRVWRRLAGLYGAGEAAPEWQTLRERLHPAAASAVSVPELEDRIHELVRDRPPARPEATGRAAVSSAHPLATAAGIEVLETGGNVVDAAVAVSFALGVVEPDASGLGGYGEMLIFLRGMDEPVVIEFLTRVPEAAGLDNAALVGGRVPGDGPVLANVPGTVRGMELAWRRYGSGMDWAPLVEPAARLAENGFVLDDAFTTTLRRERDRYLQYDGASALFFPEGEALKAGDRLTNPALAATLRAIAEEGADEFYEGEIARRIVEDLRGKGNAITATDLARYYAVERPAVRGAYRGNTVYSAAPAVGGGAALIAKLHLLENAAPSDGALGVFPEDADALHAMIEAWKLAPSGRGLIADPGLWPVDLEPLLDREAAALRWSSCFDPDRSTGPDALANVGDDPPAALACMEAQTAVAAAWGEDLWACESSPEGCRATGTTAFTVADADGNLVSVTQTLGTWGGNFYVTPELGFLYNDKLRSYGSDPTGYNARLPFARNSTSIAPTLLFRGDGPEAEPWVALGAAGNAWITSAVYQMTSGFIDAGLGPQRALELPRFLVGVRRDSRDRDAVEEIVIQYEDAIAPAVLRRLRAMGHDLQPISRRGELRMGYGAAVMVGDGVVRAGADPRRSGGAAAIQ